MQQFVDVADLCVTFIHFDCIRMTQGNWVNILVKLARDGRPDVNIYTFGDVSKSGDNVDISFKDTFG